MNTKRSGLPFTLMASLAVGLVAIVAFVSLWELWHIHRRVAHSLARQAVRRQGTTIASHLAGQDLMLKTEPSEQDWARFGEMVKSLHAMETSLEYVSVVRGDTTLFHHQTTTLEDSPALPATTTATPVTVAPRLLTVGTSEVPVVAFSASAGHSPESQMSVEVGMRRMAVDREEQILASAISSMFRLSLAATATAFAICIAMVAWMAHREVAREKQRRQEEHLIFSGVLANGIVHDFRNPMSAMRLDIQMLKRETDKGDTARLPRLAELSDRILATMDRLDAIFQEFFYLSRDAAQRPELVDVASWIGECVDAVAPVFEQAGVAVKVTTAGTPMTVLCDRPSFRRALVNVLTNARQFSQQGDTVSISAARDGSHCTIDVRDNGPGVPSADRERIFEMFVSGRPGGTGLGLFLAKTAVEGAGGTISLAPLEGGACFRIRVPLAGNGAEQT